MSGAESENPTIMKMRGELSCAVCHDLLEVPKSLPCLHTFCAKCLEDSEAARRHLRVEEREDHEDKIKCPICGCSCEVSGGTKGLTTNFVYVKLIEHLEVHQKLTSGQSLECGKCLGPPGADSSPNLAVSFCYECQAPLCEFCQQMHKRTVDLAGHNICSLDEIRQVDLSPTPARIQTSSRSDDILYVCNRHRGEPLKLYCFTCEEVICRDCIVTKKDHREHSYEFIADIIIGERAGLTECLEPLGKMKEAVVKCSNKIMSHGEDLKVRQEKRRQKIDHAFDKSIKLLESRREHLKESSQKVCEVKCKNLDLQRDEIEMVKGSVNSAIDFTRTTVEKGSNVEVLLYKKEILSRMETLKKMIAGSRDAADVLEDDCMHFVHDQTTVEKFGELCEAPCVKTSVAGGEGLVYPMQDEETTFVVQARDSKDQPLLHGGGICSAEITITPAPIGQLQTIANTVTDNHDGSYTVAYRPASPR